MTEQDQPLSGVRVLDIATFIAAPFCGTIMGDFGAEVIKIEHPRDGDPMRKFGTPTEAGDTLAWLSEARNKRCMTLDLRAPEGAELFKKLVAESDVVIENFRPGTLEKWGLGWDVLHAINPKMVMLRISAYGQTGPMRGKPGFARIAHGFAGLSYLAGEPGRPPVVPGSTSLADYMSGVWGAVGVMMALRQAEKTGRGQVVDIGLYESVFRLLDEIAPAFARHGLVRERMGADVPQVVPHGHWQTRDGRWIALACTSEKIFARLCEVMGKPELAAPDALGPTKNRLARREETNQLVADWVGSLDFEELMRLTDEAGVPCGPINSIADIFTDPQFEARGNLQTVQDPRVGEIVLPAGVPTLSETPPVLRHAGRAKSADTDDILREILDMSAQDVARLRAGGVI
ncbi:CoA transferase [Pseudoroseomonas wenyumeiae]|uniref:CoA transferase n=1 Tax=Teichococcus wenyumeiae TaxID=2478470 RepID=A0A3A9JHC2_9PROT|nr:CaiB/BaiF CoA-transferase family protein [Pseudoroseomonas wenyumeiae]RKK05770.1 CoA transferase [Pseudoroseomonas wenyumeiae]RMI24984.1 CoA transferase [Pseudoroseomonas wenyumeiae]